MNDRPSQLSTGATSPSRTGTRSQVGFAARRRLRPRRRLSQRLKRGLVGGAFLTVTSLILGLLLLIHPPRPATLVFLGADYAENLAVPDNVLGWNGLSELNQMAEAEPPSGFFPSRQVRKMTRAQKLLTPLVKRDDWKGPAWDNLTASPTVLIYIDLHGATDDQGPYFLADNPGLGERVYLKEVLDFLGTDPKVKKKNKLLLLDVTKVESHDPLAVYNDFVRRLKEFGPAIEADKRLVVICASDVGQRSWVSGELRKSVFAQSVIDGLRGKADTNKDKRVSALELYDYVAREVPAWARDNRGAEQEPLLLPAGDTGHERAARMLLNLVEESPAPAAEPAPPPKWAPPKWLTDAWAEYDGLRRGTPRPYVYAPHLWQEYREVLLRCEALARAGVDEESGSVVHLKNRLADLRSAIDKAARLDLGRSQHNSLALRRAYEPSPPAKDGGRQFQTFWDNYFAAPDADGRSEAAKPLKTWADKEGKGPASRLAFYEWLIDRVAKAAAPGDVPKYLDVAHGLGEVVSGTGNDRPAEMLFLAMMAVHLPPDVRRPENGPLLQQALRVRRLAEEAALGIDPNGGAEAVALSERIPAPIRDRIDAADQKRRVAEDHLFVGGERLGESRKLFDAAEKDYEQIAAEFAALRRASGVSALAHADLPYYDRWLAGARGDQQKDAFEDTLSLWDATHALDEQIVNGRPADLKRNTTEVANRLQKLKERFDGECNELLRSGKQRQADTWRRLNAVLATPLIDDPAKRADLLDRAGEVSWKLNGEKRSGAGEASAPAAQDDHPDEVAWHHERLAVHAIGKARFNKDLRPSEGDLSYDQANPPRPGLHDWEKELAHVSWQVSRVLRETREEVIARAKEAESPEGKPDQVLADVRGAESPCRRVYGGLLPPEAPNPVALRRRWETSDLLQWLARRTLQDRWWSEKQEGTPYFSSAAADYLLDADKLLKDSDSLFARDRGKASGELKALLEQTRWPQYRFAPEDATKEGRPFHLTGEPKLKLKFSLKVDLPLPKGAPPAGDQPLGVVAVDYDDDHLSGEPDKARHATRSGYEVAADKQAVPLPLDVDNPKKIKLLLGGEFRPAPPVSFHPTWHGLFRGRTFQGQADVYVHESADSVVSELPVPPVSGIAVAPDKDLAREKRKNILVVVLDLTPSMTWDENKLKDGKTRKKAALDALDEVLANLTREAPDTIVGIMTFGQDTKPDGGKATSPEDSIQTQWGPAPWRKGDRKKLIDNLDKLHSVWASPIARAILQSQEVLVDAAKHLNGTETEVKETLLVLTDGEDNCFMKDEELRKKGDNIRQLLKNEFKRKNVSMNLVLLSNNDEEKKKAGDQFRQFIEKDLKPKGHYYDLEIRTTKELSLALRETMRLQPNYQVLLPDGSLVAPLHASEKSAARAQDTEYRDLQMVKLPNWKYYYFKPDRYDLSTWTWLDPDLHQSVTLNPGEVLRLRLSRSRFRRSLVSEDNTKLNSDQSDLKDGWRLTGLQCAGELNSSHSIHLALEWEGKAAGDPKGDARPVIKQVRPGMVWFEVGKEKPGAANGTLWGELRGAAAPIWRIDVPQGVEWNEVTAYVSNLLPNQLGAVALFPGGVPKELRKDSRTPNASVNTSQITWGARTITPRVSVMPFDVVDGLGQTQSAVSCLVVRAEYDVDNPVRAVLGAPYRRDQVGAEHHYYTTDNGGTYTGVFWFLDGKDPEDWAPDLYLLPIKNFRSQATKLHVPRKNIPTVKDTASLGEYKALDDLVNEAKELAREKKKPGGGGDGR